MTADHFGSVFDEVYKAEGIETLRTPWHAPKANVYAEQFIRTARQECLNRIMILGPRHLESVLSTYVDHYDNERHHRGLELPPPNSWLPTPVDASGEIARRDRLDGLLHEYYRKAA